ncbi:Fatty acid hydroxylase family (carotene hydroxylase/sterol desaturase), partial [hydrothermal vent metagenome]
MQYLPAILLSSLAMTLIVGTRYLLSSGFFAWLTRRRLPGQYVSLKPQIAREIRWSLYSAAIYGIPAGIVAWGWQNAGWTQIYTDVNSYPLWYLPLSLIFYLFIHDTWFYWTHRLFHRPAWFKRAHAVHHDSRPPTAWAAMSFHPIEAISGAIVIPALVMAIPIHVGILGLILLIMTIMGVTNHMGWEIFPRWLVLGRPGKWLITASHHEK